MKYQYYTGYDYLKEWIELVLVHNCKVVIKDVGLEKAIEMMHEEAEELFALYFKILEKFDIVKKMINDNAGLNQEFIDKMMQEYAEASVHFEKKCALADTERRLDEIKEKIEGQIKLVSQSKMFESIYRMVMAKYYENIQNYQIINDTTKVYNLTKTLEIIIQIFALAKTGKINLDALMLLDNLTFVDELTDANILSSIYYNLTLVNESNIYLKKNRGINAAIWYVLVQKEGSLYLRYYDAYFRNCVKEYGITEKKLTEEYIPLDQFIKEMKPVGEIRILLGTSSKILCSNGMYAIELDDNNSLNIDYEFDTSKKVENFTIPIEYQDKEFVKLKIIEMVQDILNQGVKKTKKKML